jgi:hypothetical protein
MYFVNKFIFKEKTYSVQNFWNDPRRLVTCNLPIWSRRKGGLRGQHLFEYVASQYKTPVCIMWQTEQLKKIFLWCLDDKCFCTDSNPWAMLRARQKSQPTLSAFLKYIPIWRHIERIWVHLCHHNFWRMAANGGGAIPMVNEVKIFGNMCSETLMGVKRGWRYIGYWLCTEWNYSLKSSLLRIFNQKSFIVLSIVLMHLLYYRWYWCIYRTIHSIDAFIVLSMVLVHLSYYP